MTENVMREKILEQNYHHLSTLLGYTVIAVTQPCSEDEDKSPWWANLLLSKKVSLLGETDEYHTVEVTPCRHPNPEGEPEFGFLSIREYNPAPPQPEEETTNAKDE